VCIQHPKFAALTVCEFNPDHVNDEHKPARTFARAARCPIAQSLASRYTAQDRWRRRLRESQSRRAGAE